MTPTIPMKARLYRIQGRIAKDPIRVPDQTKLVRSSATCLYIIKSIGTSNMWDDVPPASIQCLV